MTYFHPAWLEHQRKRYLRADAYRFAAPGTPEAKMPGWLDPSMTRVRWKEAQEEEARAAFAAEVKRLQAQQDRLCEMFAEIKYEFAWRKLCRKYGYNPDQPRDEQGRWTSGANRVGDAVAASSGDDNPAAGGDAESQRTRIAQAGFGTLLAEIPVPGGRRCVYISVQSALLCPVRPAFDAVPRCIGPEPRTAGS